MRLACYGNSCRPYRAGNGMELLLVFLLFLFPFEALAQFNEPWREKKYAIVLDAYELNPLDWTSIVENKRIAGFIGKASDGLQQEYCSDRTTLCGAQWRKYSVSRELYQTRRTLAKALGLKWGSYHLGRRGNPELQAVHYLQYARPTDDEIIVLDLESLDGDEFMTLEEAERFVRYIYKRIGRYPLLYANHQVSRQIAADRENYPLLSRLKLWYARYKPEISDVFPMGNWDGYTLWQFAYGGNCNTKSCPYRIKGAPDNIDVNVAPMSVAELREQWPFDGLLEQKPFPVEPTPEDVLMANTIEDPESEKHSDFVTDPDYNPRNVPPGSVLTAPGSELAAGGSGADAVKTGATMTVDTKGSADASGDEPDDEACPSPEDGVIESDDLAGC